jgi:hypothetical protein
MRNDVIVLMMMVMMFVVMPACLMLCAQLYFYRFGFICIDI